MQDPSIPRIPRKVDSILTVDQKESAIRLYFCRQHYPLATGNGLTCPKCVRASITARHGDEALTETPVHLRNEEGVDYIVCGLNQGPIVTTDQPRRVTCPDCLIVDYIRQPGNDPLMDWVPPLPPAAVQPDIPPHQMPHWAHDCDLCIWLGTRYGSGRSWDLYWCPPNDFGGANLVARHGIDGDYVSGMDFIDREPMLAVAAILALKQGYRNFIPGVS